MKNSISLCVNFVKASSLLPPETTRKIKRPRINTGLKTQEAEEDLRENKNKNTTYRVGYVSDGLFANEYVKLKIANKSLEGQEVYLV